MAETRRHLDVCLACCSWFNDVFVDVGGDVVEVSLSPPSAGREPSLLKDVPPAQQAGEAVYSAKDHALRGRVVSVKGSWTTYVTGEDVEKKMRTGDAVVDWTAESPGGGGGGGAAAAAAGGFRGKKALFKRKREEENDFVGELERDEVDLDDDSDSDSSDSSDEEDAVTAVAKAVSASRGRSRNSTQWVRRSVRMPGQEQVRIVCDARKERKA